MVCSCLLWIWYSQCRCNCNCGKHWLKWLLLVLCLCLCFVLCLCWCLVLCLCFSHCIYVWQSEASGHWVYEATTRQSEHHSFDSKGRHTDAGRVSWIQEDGMYSSVIHTAAFTELCFIEDYCSLFVDLLSYTTARQKLLHILTLRVAMAEQFRCSWCIVIIFSIYSSMDSNSANENLALKTHGVASMQIWLIYHALGSKFTYLFINGWPRKTWYQWTAIWLAYLRTFILMSWHSSANENHELKHVLLVSLWRFWPALPFYFLLQSCCHCLNVLNVTPPGFLFCPQRNSCNLTYGRRRQVDWYV